jgi:uncharacterized repeat protein (TIGR01451 family)
VHQEEGEEKGKEVGEGEEVTMFKRYASVLVAVCALAVVSAPASAFTAGPGWEVNSHSYPTNLSPGGSGRVAVDVYNVGSVPSGDDVIVTDTLPEGLTAVSSEGWSCTATAPVVCTQELNGVGVEEKELLLDVGVKPGTAEGEVPNVVTVAGGGAPSTASATNLLTIGSRTPGFGFPLADSWFTNADGTVDMQAGSHPYELTFDVDLNTEAHPLDPADKEELRNFTANVPPGLIGNPYASPRCIREQFDIEECPASTQIGVIVLNLGDTGGEAPFTLVRALYNVVPQPGIPAQFGFDVLGIQGFIDASVRTGGDYGITEHINDAPQRGFVRSRVTLWGVPADPSHDSERKGVNCSNGCSSGEPLTPLLTLPTSCMGPQAFSISADTWLSLSTEATFGFLSHAASGVPAGFTGCERLGFAPSLSVAPDTSQADAPAGLTVDVKIPQGGLVNAEALAESDVKDASVVLPEGLTVNPGRAAGLQACQTSQDGVGTEAAPSCPAVSQVGIAQISTPLLAERLEGGVYVLQSNPPNLQLLVAASADGVNVKLVGNVHLDEATGRLTATFSETPQVPFTDLKLTLTGGPQGALTTPADCGTYTTTSDFTPWSTPVLPDATPSSSFAVESGVAASPCGTSPGFAPSFTAGTVNNQAGTFSAFSLTLSRQDPEQGLSAVQVKTPPGLLGVLNGVERCPEPQASQGACGTGSLIGHTTVAVGTGPDPLYVQGGQVFLTGPYKGAPFGLSIVVPAVAGPFNLGNVVVRAAVSVDPHTAQITVSSDPLPTILDGVPLQVKTVNVSIDRAGFMFNPTDCEPLTVDGTLTSTQGTNAAVSSRFQAANCASLGFHPSFSVSSQAKTNKKNGASLVVKIGYPPGSQANIRSVAVTLPKQLPARLTTIQQACPEATFNANPASCPAGSAIGTGTATTPILAGSFTGPAYLVSHGGAAFPDLVMVLQGEGVTLDLVGSIDIKHNVTSSTFASVPDAPISSFQVSLPEGPHSGLAAVVPAKAKGSLCGQSLVMPTTLTGQNGAVIKQSTKIVVTGCPKAKKKSKSRAKGKTKKKGGKR